jgi:hypothetical protein
MSGDPKFTMSLDGKAIETVRRLQNDLGGTSIKDVFERALGLLEFWRTIELAGCSLAVIDRRKDVVRELVSPFGGKRGE